MNFFFDNCLSPNLAHAIAALAKSDDDKVEHLSDRFKRDASDAEWMKALGDEGGWTVISGDFRILKNPHERKAWHQAKLTGFFLASSWNDFRLYDKAWRLVKRWPAIRTQADLVEPGAAFEVPISSARFRQLVLKS